MPLTTIDSIDISKTIQEFLLPVGTIITSATHFSPDGFLLCDGSSIPRTIFSKLFNSIVPNIGIANISNANPGIITLVNHKLQTGSSFYLTTSGVLPTNLSLNTLYYAFVIDPNSFRICTTFANAFAGNGINTTGTQSGNHSLMYCPYGFINADTFRIPDLIGGVPRGAGISVGYTQNVTVALGSKQDDAFQGHSVLLESWFGFNSDGSANPRNAGYGEHGPYGEEITSRGFRALGAFGIPRVSNETKMKNIGVNFFIKF